MSWTFDKIVRAARKLGASDIHLVQGIAPAFRVNGEIQASDGDALDAASLKTLLGEVTSEAQRAALTEQWQLCFTRQWPECGRFRTSVYMHSGCAEMAIRLCEPVVRTADELGLPAVVSELTSLPNGLILVTGPTGMGKTTTLNFMVHAINRQRRCKIITIEDPVEFVHQNERSIVIQQEVNTDTPSFRKALIHALRQDPDVVVIGEMRDLETIETALIAAETGHLVIATLHTPDSVQTLQRIFSVFPAEQQNSITVQLASSIQAILSQRLLPRADGNGRVVALEVCMATSAVRKHIRDREVHMLYNEMQVGRKHKMQSMDSALWDLYQRGEITYDVALAHAREPDSLRLKTGDRKTAPARATL